MSYEITWVKLEKYADLTGDSIESVMARRRAGKWLDGNQCKVVDGRIWINLPAAQGWVENWDRINPQHLAMPAPPKARK